MKVLITGGCGYIGYSLINSLDKNDNIDSIIVYDNLSNSNNNFFLSGTKLKKVSFIEGDILDNILLEESIKKVDNIIHLAAQVTYPFAYNNHHKHEQINHYGSLQLYQILLKYPAKKIIYLSSSTVYGFQNVENENCIPKYNGEKYIQLLNEKSDVFILRSANVFGHTPCMRTNAVINWFILDSIMNNKLVIYGNGKQTRSFIFIDLLVQEIKNCLFNKYKPGIFNLVQGNISLEELRDVLIENISGLEFTYVSASSTFPSSTMKSNKIYFEQKLIANITSTFKEIKKHIY